MADPIWDLLDDLALLHARLRPFTEELERDFTAVDAGYAQLRAIADEKQRAVVSDQICQSALAIRSNLVEAKLHATELQEVVGTDGVRFPEDGTAKDTLKRSARMDMAITGCVRALGSSLDCLGAVTVGVLRIPLSIQRASSASIGQAVEPKRLAKGTLKQREAWTNVDKLRQVHEQKPPAGWFDWLLGMRNLNVHRARQVHILLQRTRDADQPQLIVPSADPDAVTRQMARFDLHLRKRPGLPDMYDFITSASTGDLWINERVTTTLPGVVSATNALVEEMAHFLLEWWRYARKWPTDFPPPVAEWSLPTPPWPSFDGVAPRTTPFPVHTGRGSALLAERLELAERLR